MKVSPQKQLKPSSLKKKKFDFCSFRLEKETGKSFVVGIDEVGRGPLAGPVVSAAVCFDKEIWDSEETWLQEIQDSKKLSEKKREELFEVIYQRAKWIEIAELDAQAIDRFNILQATFQSFQMLIEAAQKKNHEIEFILVDGNQQIPRIRYPQQAVVGGDRFSKSIAAASIIAKVHRDRLMTQYALQYPVYGFEKHKGYGTAQHRLALQLHGPAEVHRMSFLRGILKKETGRDSERKARLHLEELSFQLLEANWSSKMGEIDLVMTKDNELHFFEVRTSPSLRVDFSFPSTKQVQVRKCIEQYLSFKKEAAKKEVHFHLVLVAGDELEIFWDILNGF